MKRIVNVVSVILMVAVLAVSMCGCIFEPKTDEELIRERVDEFIFAYNSGDIEAAFDCFDAKSRKTYGAIFKIGGGLLKGFTGIDVDISDLFALAVGTTNEDLLSMEIHSIEITGETTATVTLSMKYSDARVEVEESIDNMALNMVKEKGDWYINARADWESLLNY